VVTYSRRAFPAPRLRNVIGEFAMYVLTRWVAESYDELKTGTFLCKNAQWHEEAMYMGFEKRSFFRGLFVPALDAVAAQYRVGIGIAAFHHCRFHSIEDRRSFSRNQFVILPPQ
jgi:hypothetical protein